MVKNKASKIKPQIVESVQKENMPLNSEIGQEKTVKNKIQEALNKEKDSKADFILKFKKFRCLPFLLGLFLALVFALVVPVAVYVLASLNLTGNDIWYVSIGTFFSVLVLLFFGGIFFRRIVPSFSTGLLFGLAISVIISLIFAAAVLILLVWVEKSTQVSA